MFSLLLKKAKSKENCVIFLCFGLALGKPISETKKLSYFSSEVLTEYEVLLKPLTMI